MLALPARRDLTSPALESQSGLELFFDKIFVPGAFVQRDSGRAWFMCFFLRHKRREVIGKLESKNTPFHPEGGKRLS
jgi:hypothetical protein